MTEDTITVDKVVYDFPGRMVRLMRNGHILQEIEAFGLDPIDGFDGIINIDEKSVTLTVDHRKAIEVAVSYSEFDWEGETVKEDYWIEDISAVS